MSAPTASFELEHGLWDRGLRHVAHGETIDDEYLERHVATLKVQSELRSQRIEDRRNIGWSVWTGRKREDPLVVP